MSKNICYVYDPFMSLHDHPFDDHPECGDRIHMIYQELMNRGYIYKMMPIQSRFASRDELLLAHTEEFVDKITADLSLQNARLITNALNNKANKRYYKSDLFGNEETLKCALMSAGSTVSITDAILNNKAERGVAIVRPPSHHCHNASTGGFCIFNGVAIAAIKAHRAGKKVAIVDLDIHYGDGTVDIIKEYPEINYFSIHRYDNGGFYPWKGKKSSYPNIHNFPLNYSNGDDNTYLSLLNSYIIPGLQEIKPDLIIVSAGFDCLRGDPIGEYNVTPEGYGKMIHLLLGVQSKLAIVLEGGYNLESISQGMAECVKELLVIEHYDQ